jgi:F-type H+-transporting ATPase subunit gamma
MSSRQQIKSQIGSVKQTKQITRAMQMVAASKLRRAQTAASKPRTYAEMAREILVSLRYNIAGEGEFPLFQERPVKERLLIVTTSDQGLAGAYNGNVIRRMLKEISVAQAESIRTSVICLGWRAAQAASRIADLEIRAVYQGLPDKPGVDDLRPILTSVVGLFADSIVDAVDIMYTRFISTVSQTVEVRRLLPAGLDDDMQSTAVSRQIATATIEPSADVLVRSVTLRLLDALIYQSLLEAAASEHSMRMLAMKNATDNATDIIDDLTIEYNKARQAAITQELAEITGGAEAMR